jgi:hypothetical protein
VRSDFDHLELRRLREVTERSTLELELVEILTERIKSQFRNFEAETS